MIIWSILEVYSAMICTSLIAIRPLVMRYWPRVFGSIEESEGSHPLTSREFSGNTGGTGEKWGSRRSLKGMLGMGSSDEMELKDQESSRTRSSREDEVMEIRMTKEFSITEVQIEMGAGK